MKQFGATIRQSTRLKLDYLVKKKRLYMMARRLYMMAKKKDPYFVGEVVDTELDQMYRETVQAIDKIVNQLGNDGLIQEIREGLLKSDRELDQLPVSPDSVDRLINSVKTASKRSY